ncbi:MAG: IS110 family transposase [Deltaproteobacteria bacterium CG11_big_fil_rev_8_21_14_0_20_47_16]|nr:MAG: IS110 family transposase [Deltaproteobacteria bacterium CG11_big_fil_rev_8_21_14_0_20_47_16]
MSQEYTTFIGIDIGKFECVATLHGSKETHTFANTPEAIASYVQAHRDILSKSLVVLETTGGYEKQLLLYLIHHGVRVHRANTRKVKNFIRSYGTFAKTDALDAAALALYGAERYPKLSLYEENPYEQLRLLQERRQELVCMRTQEKNRLQAPGNTWMRGSFEKVLQVLEAEITALEKEMQTMIQGDPVLKEKVTLLMTIDGVGVLTAQNLLAQIPELGTLNKKQVASLAGVAPHPNQSGTKKGYTRTRGGRRQMRPTLFIAAFTAARSKARLGQFYQRLVAAGKPKMVALVAVMRKIIVIANARIKEAFPPLPEKTL